MTSRRQRARPAEGLENNVEDGEELLNDRNIPPSIKGDEGNIAILFFLYLLQGIPLGLMQAIPIILTNKGVSYKQQAQFSLVNWPFSLKLLWAPIVDSLYWSSMGKRKSWMVPSQYIIGGMMIILSQCIDSLLGGENEEANMVALVVAFFFLNFLAATQDIAVDGWALTMLKRENVGYASTCNSVGQTAGYLFGYVAFIALESASFCNTYVRTEQSDKGLVTLAGFLNFWGWTFLVTTTLVWLFKGEKPSRSTPDQLSIKDSYRTLWRIVALRPIRLLALVLLTGKIAFSACDALTGLKLIETGVPKEKLALLAIPLVPLQIVLPLVLSRTTTGPYPMNVYLTAYPFRIAFSLLIAAFVWITPFFVDNGSVPNSYYVFLIVIYGFYQVALYSMFVSQMAFFAKISDPVVGGTYMTLVNTLANMGGNWPSTMALYLVEGLTLKQCSTDTYNYCQDQEAVKACTTTGGNCSTHIDGYYLESVLCALVGLLWLMWGRGAIKKLQRYPMRLYAVTASSAYR